MSSMWHFTGRFKMLFSKQCFVLFLISNPVAHQCVTIVSSVHFCEFMLIRELEMKELSLEFACGVHICR